MSDAFRLLIFADRDYELPTEVRQLTTQIETSDYDIDKMMEPFSPLPDVVLCFAPNEDFEISNLEIAQTLRSVYEHHPIFFITQSKDNFDKKKINKKWFYQCLYFAMGESRSGALYERGGALYSNTSSS